MNNLDNNRDVSFEKLCRRILGGCESEGQGQGGGGLFEREWEVFVARFDRKSGKYESLTFCCEGAVSE